MLSTPDLGAKREPSDQAPLEREAEWLRSFEQEHGRPLRVLHIGNIANNAYNNAKIQRQKGVEADVLSFDYYHILACPEWEDASFTGKIEDDFFPDWWGVDLGGFTRPDWFVAGPLDLSIRYLLAKTAGKPSAKWLWHALTFERWLLSRKSPWAEKAKAAILRVSGQAISYPTTPANGLLMSALGRRLVRAGQSKLLKGSRVGEWLNTRGERLVRFARTANLGEDAGRHVRMMQRNVEELRGKNKALFDQINRSDLPNELEFFYQWWWHPYISLLFSRYDIVQGYATYTALPYIAGVPNYVAYEHGTIRSIPFQETREGRMCMASYRAAAATFVTNVDNLDAAQRMRLARDRVVPLPHAFESDKLLDFEAGAGVPKPGPDEVVTFVAPARQHWVDADPGWAKGNDRIFAALRLLKDTGLRCKLRAIAWGNDLEASRARVEELGISDMVEWVPVMKKRELWGEYLKAHAVIDQFLIPTFSGVTFEAMMLGRRVITNIDDAQAERFFGQAPPLYSCRSAEEIAAAMRRVIEDPADEAGDGEANRSWMKQYHSAERIVALQSAAYRRVIENKDKDQIPPNPWLTEQLPAEWRKTLKPFLVTKDWLRTSGGRDVVMLVVSALRIDPRVEREARALVKAGWRVTIIAPDISSPLAVEQPIDWGPDVKFHLLPFDSAQYVMNAPWLASEEMYQAAMAYRPFAYHCHDLTTVPIGLRAARDTGARCICDFHEWYSENVSWDNGKAAWVPHEPQKRFLFRWIERLALRRADMVITVNETIARELDQLGRKPLGTVKVLRNIPPLSLEPTRSYPPLKQQLSLPESTFVVMYQGGTGPSRMLEPVIKALAYAPKVTFVIRGPSLDLFGDGYREVAREAGVSDRLILRDALPSRDVVAAARGTDVGLWILPNLSKNFYLALPNKIFEYLAAGLPLLVANFPEAVRIAEGMNVGLSFDPYDPKSIAAQMNRLADDPELLRRCREAVPVALETLDADKEWDRLAALYQQLASM